MMPKGTRVFVCKEPQDMRRSFDGLALLGEDPQGGAMFCFANKRKNRLKIHLPGSQRLLPAVQEAAPSVPRTSGRGVERQELDAHRRSTARRLARGRSRSKHDDEDLTPIAHRVGMWRGPCGPGPRHRRASRGERQARGRARPLSQAVPTALGEGAQAPARSAGQKAERMPASDA